MPVDLDNLKIASPCNASWAAMKGDDQVRHCASCQHCVFNVSALTREEATTLIESRTAKGKRTCIRLYRRQDGTVITQDCAIGTRRKWTVRTAIGATIIAGMALISGVAAAATAAIRPTTSRKSGLSLAGKCEQGFMRQRDRLGHSLKINSWCNCAPLMGIIAVPSTPPPPPPSGSKP